MILLHAIAPARRVVDHWVTADSRTIPVRQMTDEHIRNVANRFLPILDSLLPERRLMLEAVLRERERRRAPTRH